MARLTDISVETCRDFLRGILDRNSPRDGVSFRVELHISVEEGRILWAADKHLEVYETIGMGIELTDFTLAQVRRRLGELVADVRMQAEKEEIVLALSLRDLKLFADAEVHLDRFLMQSQAPPPRPKKNKR